MKSHTITFKSLFKKKSIISLLIILLPGVLLFLALAYFHNLFGISISTYTRDADQVLNGKPYVGFVSTIGLLLWSATAAILFYSSVLASKQNKSKELKRYLIFGGIFTTFMLLDDAFLFHDVIFPDYFSINEKVFYLTYGLILITFLFVNRKFIFKTDYILLLLAFALFVGSAGIDQIIELFGDIHGEYLFEDGFKFLGISCWFAYFTRASYSILVTENQE